MGQALRAEVLAHRSGQRVPPLPQGGARGDRGRLVCGRRPVLRTDAAGLSQDEIYVVVAGSGVFRRGEERVPFGPGDLLFAPASVPHAFETFTGGLQTWLIFFGPKGGCAQAS
jgi:hypothetical protein